MFTRMARLRAGGARPHQIGAILRPVLYTKPSTTRKWIVDNHMNWLAQLLLS